MCVKVKESEVNKLLLVVFRHDKSCGKNMPARIRNFGIAVITTGLAWLVDILLQEKFSESSVALYFAAALVSTWFGGLGPGLTAIGLTIGINLIFFDHPYLSLAVGVHGFERLILFSGVALVMVSLVERIRRSQKQLRDLNSELENKVEQRTAALNESNQQLEAFCYTLAHDLRAPLRAIQGFAELLIQDRGAELSPEARTDTERIRNSAERMGRLILDLLAYTELERADFRKQFVDLEPICKNVLRMFADEIQRTGAVVSLDLQAQCVLGDRAGIERVLVNLMANALRFSDPQRPPRIKISSERKTKMPNIQISVADNGIGLDTKYRDRIFGVFERLTSGSQGTGTGIGLAIVKRSVEKKGGTVGVESTPGVGSRFWFELAEASLEISDPLPKTDGEAENGSPQRFFFAGT
jgi:signal transduction histidine kinase